MAKLRTRIYQLMGSALGPVILYLLVILFIGPIWHIVYGDFITHSGWKIRVPKGFFVGQDRDGYGPKMWKLTLGILIWHRRYEIIGIFDLPPRKPPFQFDRDYEGFATGVMKVAQQDGFKLRSTQRVPMASTVAHCLEFVKLGGEQNSLVRCAIEGSRIVLFYDGDQRYVADVYSMLEGSSAEKPGPKAAQGGAEASVGRGETKVSFGDRISYVLFLLFLLSPVLPLGIAWRRFFSQPPDARCRKPLTLMCVLAASWTLVFPGLLFQNLFSPKYSTQRNGIIWANWVVVFLAFMLLLARSKEKTKIPLLFSALLLFVIWSISALLASIV